ncbi:hypothetical protein EVG20_g3447 [Dentipellis fragilis]|uniref:Phosphatidylglycerol lysyltransferase C-terminal domain-containing protein n=1 Tax=Dentipellis fragilis TaxID=205917 RepID=A0A4Y9Z4A4_9AGAM|nr:hypothetical protein EVG20_g3447 [Dentipellis fragilis]
MAFRFAFSSMFRAQEDIYVTSESASKTSDALSWIAELGDAPSTDKSEIAELVASYGSSSATAWLEFERYKIWRPSIPIPQSSFPPVQGYLRSDPYIFAWGNPLVSDPSALTATAAAFRAWCQAQKLRLVWCCVDDDMEKVLSGGMFRWSTLTCIVEDVIDPQIVVEVVKMSGGGSDIKDLKKNLRRAERAKVTVREVQKDEWTEEQKREVEQGVLAWKESRKGIQIASTSFQSWLDFKHRRYWVAEHEGVIVGLLILAPIHPSTYQIKNAVSFPTAPRGTSEELIYRVMHDLQNAAHHDPRPIEIQTRQKECSLPLFPNVEMSAVMARAGMSSDHDDDVLSNSSGSSSSSNSSGAPSRFDSPGPSPVSSASSLPPLSPMEPSKRTMVTFGVSASDSLTPVHNLSGWKITWLGKTYGKIMEVTGLTKRGDFRNKFQSEHVPSYVCYPADMSFGIEGVNSLINCLRQ